MILVKGMLTLFFLMLLRGGIAYAIEPVALPAFTVQNMTNAPVQGDQLSQAPRWLLIYLPADCRHCDDILHALEPFQKPPLSNRVVVVAGGGTPEAIRGLIGPREKIASLGWYTDPEWQAYQMLHISGMPMIFGIRDGVIEWSLSGIPWDDKTMRSILLDWVNY